jgi:hypothetical protein
MSAQVSAQGKSGLRILQRFTSANANLADPRCGSQLRESIMTKQELTLEARIREDAVFDRGSDLSGAVGNKAIGAHLHSPGHQAAIAGGLAHLASLPHITINGDTAVVVSYLQILTPNKTGDAVEVPNHGASRGYHIHRVVTNRWDLLRTPSGWKIKRRTLRLVDGSEPARDILRSALPAA